MAEPVFEQLPLGISLRDDATFANFFAGDNAEVVAQLQRMAAGQGDTSLYVWGKAGAGCSHLLQAACHSVQENGGNSVYLPMDELVDYSPAVFESLEALPLVCLDNCQVLAGKAEWEEALFHLFNRMRAAEQRLVIAADAPPAQVGFVLPDLLSRLKWGFVYQLEAMDDDFKIQALKLRAANRGMELNDEVARYLLNRAPRDMHALFAVLEQLDKASLQAQRRLTIPFVKQEMHW